MINPFKKGPFSNTFAFIIRSKEGSREFDHWRDESGYNFQGIMLD